MFRLRGFANATRHGLKMGAEELPDRSRIVLKVGEGALHRRNQGLKGREVAVVGLSPLDVAPQMLNRVVIRRIPWQLMHRQPLGILGHKLRGFTSHMVRRTVIHSIGSACAQWSTSSWGRKAGVTYGYDSLQRLTSATQALPNLSYTYVYDAVGNRTEVRLNGLLTQMQLYNAADQVVGWLYDAAGNLTNNITNSYTYDPLRALAQLPCRSRKIGNQIY